MTTIDPEEIVKKYIAAKDNHDWDALVALLAPDYTSSDPSVAEPVKGIEAIRQYFGMLELVDMKTKILTMMSKGNDVAAELAVACTIKPTAQLAGQISLPTGHSFEIKFAKFYRVNSEGLLVEEREYSDTAAKFQALGKEGAAAFQALGEKAVTLSRTHGKKT